MLKINGKETIKMSKKGEYVKFKNFERKLKSLFMIYTDFESILVPEDNEKEHPNESLLVCVDDKFNNPFK